MHNLPAILCSIFLIVGCGGGGGSEPITPEPTPPPTPPTPPPTATFSDDPIILSDIQSYYVDQCLIPNIGSVIPVDINGDQDDDFIIHYWCPQEEFGNSVRTDTPNAIVAYVSTGGVYDIDNYNVFGESYVSLTGASRKVAVADINGDGKEDIAFAMNNEDGRATWEPEDQLSNGAIPVVLLSTETGYEIFQLGVADWGHEVQITTTGDVLFTGYNVGTQAFNYNGSAWANVTDYYPELSPKSHLVGPNVSYIANEVTNAGEVGVEILQRSGGEWVSFADYFIKEEFKVQLEGWNNTGSGNYSDIGVFKFNNVNYIGGNIDKMCLIQMNDKTLLVPKIQSMALIDGTEPQEGLSYQEVDTTPVNLFIFLDLVENELQLFESPIEEEMINYNFNEFSCEDITSNGRGDIVASVFSQNWDEDTPERRGVPIVYINDGSDTLVTVDTSEWPTFSEDLQDSLGFMNDINNDGLVDLIMHGITTEYNGNVEIYLANSNID